MDLVIAANYVAILDKALQEYGKPGFLRSLHYPKEQLQDPNAFLSHEQFFPLVEKAIDFGGCPQLGLLVGQSLSIGNHGLLGYAAMSSATLSQALETMLQYLDTRTNIIRMRLRYVKEGAYIQLEVQSASLVIVRFMVEMLSVHIHQLRYFLLQQALRCPRMDFRYPKPEYYALYSTFIEAPLKFSAQETRIWFSKEELHSSTRFADDASFQQALQQLQTITEVLAMKEDVGSRVEAVLHQCDLSTCSMEQIASQLHMSSRTLRRHLHAEGKGYQALLDKVRCARAQTLLSSAGLSLQQIAFELGFQDTSNFTKAFRRWTGLSPTQFRDNGLK